MKPHHPVDESERYVDDTAPSAEFVPASIRDAAAKRFAHVKRASAFMSAWKEMRESLYLGHVLPFAQLPAFCEKYARLLFDTSEHVALRAVRIGDPAFFIAWLFRVDQIDAEMLRIGSTLADRAVLVRTRASLDAYRDVAEEQLRKLGGRWPPGGE